MSTYETVLQATRDLHHSGVVVTRETLESTTGMKLTTIDENVKRGIECGDIVRIHRGVYMPNAQNVEPRPISRTCLADGTVLIEVGDEVLHLNAAEARMLGTAMAGDAMHLANINVGNQLAELKTELTTLKNRRR